MFTLQTVSVFVHEKNVDVFAAFGANSGVTRQDNTLTLYVHLSADEMDAVRSQGVVFAVSDISDNWLITLNGKTVSDTRGMGEDGEVKTHRYITDILFDIPSDFFHTGENRLTVQFYGVTNDYIDMFADNADNRVQTPPSPLNRIYYFDFIVAGIYLFIGFYHLVIALSYSDEAPYKLWFGLSCVGIFFMLVLKIQFWWEYGVDSEVVTKLQAVAMFFALTAMGEFMRRASGEKPFAGVIAKTYLSAGVVLIALMWLVEGGYGNAVLVLVEVIGAIYLLFVPANYLVRPFLTKKKKKYSRFLKETAVSSVVVLLFLLFDIVAGFLGWSIHLSVFGFLFYAVGVSVNLAWESEHYVETADRMQIALLKTMADLVESRDDVTGGHVERTSRALMLLLDGCYENAVYQDEISSWGTGKEFIAVSSQLHDVGKIHIADSLLKKPGKLSDEEFTEMKNHTTYGAEIIGKIEKEVPEAEFLRHSYLFAESHQEKWDGSGYPKGLKGEDIPLQGRLLAIADVYDALRSARPYKEGFDHKKAARIIVEGSGSHFDPRLVGVFQAKEREIEDMYVTFTSVVPDRQSVPDRQ
jgi:HD-GYP domain-containing protein (c-di-GMP phosphodiesterase class II)